jgi:hypothetical protein
MAKIKKYVQLKNLASRSVWVTDDDPTSRYFRLAQIPDVLTAGKNAFLINGSDELVPTTEILIELVDSTGKTVFLQPIKNFVEGLARVVSIEVYEDTAAGPATLTILGHLRVDEHGQTPPPDFITAYNVKWQKQINIAPERLNHTPIRLYNRPTLAVSELLVPFRSSSIPAKATINTGTVQFSSVGPLQTTYVTSLTPTLRFTRAMLSGAITATVNGSPYSASIIDIVNGTLAVLDTPLSSSLVPVSYSLNYQPATTFGLTVESRSFADVRLNNLTTFSGEIHRGRIYARSLDQSGDYQIVSDIKLQPAELTVTSSISTGQQIIRLGDFTGQSTADSYWEEGIIQNQALYVVTGSVNLLYTSSVSLDSAHLNTGSLAGSYLTPNYFFRIATLLPFVKNHEYTVESEIALVNTSGNPARMDVYLKGTAFPSSSADPLGVQVASYTFGAGVTTTRFSISENVSAYSTGTAMLRFVVYNGEWHVGNVGVVSADERGFNPDEVRVLIPIANRRLENLQFKAELFDANSNVLPVNVESTPVFFSGSTFTTRGTDNTVTGVIKVGTQADGGISLTSLGYTGSDGTPVPDKPAIFIGGGRYAHPATPFFVGSGSAGTLFSLGDQLTWDGHALTVIGDITLNSGSNAYGLFVSASASAAEAIRAAQSASTAASESQAYQISTLDPKIFTDSTGLIVRPPTASAAGLYLGKTNLGYFSGSMWKTYMSDIGNFYLTGSNGSSNYLAWDGTTLQIAGQIVITAGATLATINAATQSANNAVATASAASSSVSNAFASASIASASAAAASSSAALALTSASLVDAKVFTDSTGKLVRPPVTTSAGLFLGSTFLGYFSGSAWKTYMANNGNFFLTGSSGNFLSWNAGTLTINGNITIVGGPARTELDQTISTASAASSSAGAAQSTADGALTSASNAQSTASAAFTSASNAQATASQAFSTASLSLASASLVDAKVFTDSTGKLVKAANTSSTGLYLGSTFLGFYSASQWRTFMSDTGNFFLTGSSSNFLSWNGTTLTIAGNITILGGQAQTDIINAATSGTNAQATANAATGSAATAQATANAATGSASAASASAALANTSASLLDTKIFTDNTGKLVKPPVSTSAGLFIGSTFLGYFSGSSWRTYMANNGNFFLTGSASNFLSWNGTTLSIAGDITLVAGTALSNQFNAVSSSAVLANVSASQISTDVSTNVKPTIFTDSTGKITKTPTTGTAGLYLGSTFMGYYNGSAWKTYMSNTGNFFLNGGTGANYLSWDGTTLNIAGSINIVSATTQFGASVLPGQNLLTSAKDWKLNATPLSQASVLNFNINGPAADNDIEIGANPAGQDVLLWHSIGDAVGQANGGWNTDNIPIDSTKTYRYTCWVKRTGTNTGSTYHGVGGATVCDIATGVRDDNPYFFGGSLPSIGEWYLLVGYVYPYNYGTTQRQNGGVYRKLDGGKYIALYDFKWLNSTISSTNWRTYLYYATTSATHQYHWNPRVDIVDGSEPTVDQLLSIGVQANSNAATAQTSANNAQSSANTAQTSANNAQTSANNAQNTATNVTNDLNSNVKPTIFTDSTGKITKTPSSNGAGLYLGSTNLGYYNGSVWKTYMSNTGNFFLSGTGANNLSWDGTTLTINGAITVTGGNAATTTYADGAASTAQSNAISTAASDATSKANAVDAKVFTDAGGRVVKTPSSTGAGLYLGSTNLGYFDGSTWKTYMANNGNFYLSF